MLGVVMARSGCGIRVMLTLGVQLMLGQEVSTWHCTAHVCRLRAASCSQPCVGRHRVSWQCRRTDNAVKNRWAALCKKDPHLERNHVLGNGQQLIQGVPPGKRTWGRCRYGLSPIAVLHIASYVMLLHVCNAIAP